MSGWDAGMLCPLPFPWDSRKGHFSHICAFNSQLLPQPANSNHGTNVWAVCLTSAAADKHSQMKTRRLLGIGDRCSNPPAWGMQAQWGAGKQYGTQQEEQNTRSEQLPFCLLPAAKPMCTERIRNASLPPTTCIDKDAFSKVTMAVCSINHYSEFHLKGKSFALVKKSSKATNFPLCFVQ